MNIGFDASHAFIDKKTGTENYSYQLLKHLAKIDQVNNYLMFLRPRQSVQKDHWPANFKFLILDFKFLWTQVGLALQTFKDPLDVLFIPAHTLPLIKKPGLKTVVTVHDLGAEYLPQTHQLKQRLYLNFMTHYQLKSATHLIAVSQATKNDLVKKIGIPVKKISVVYEAYNQELFKPIKGIQLYQTLKNYNLEPGHYYLFVGTIQPRKNLERLIRAYTLFARGPAGNQPHPTSSLSLRAVDGVPRLLPPLASKPILVLAGSKGWLAEDIYRLPKELGIEEKVKFLGYVPDKDLPALYSGAQAFLFPSLFEGFGLPILEAMACGCPVLTSNISSMPEIARKAAILVDPYSVEDIAQGIERIKLIKAGFGQVKKFSWEKCAKETLTVLEKITNSSLNS